MLYHGSEARVEKLERKIIKNYGIYGIYVTDCKDVAELHGDYVYEYSLNHACKFLYLQDVINDDLFNAVINSIKKTHYAWIKNPNDKIKEYILKELGRFRYSVYLFYHTLRRILFYETRVTEFFLSIGIDGIIDKIGKTRTDYIIFNDNIIEKHGYKVKY